jgi:transcriptional regulator with XRE-family HTH domain
MAKKPVNNLRAWREYRELTQEQLAEKIGTTPGVISLLESGKRGLSLKWLLKFAPALRTTPGMILDHDPNDLDTSILEIWATVPDAVKPQATQILQTFSRKNRA